MNRHLHDVELQRPQEGTAVAVFREEHDIADAPDVETMLDSLLQENELVVVDFSEAVFVDSSILYALMNSDRAARERGKTFRLQLGTALIIEKAFQLSGVSELLDCYATREEVLRVTETA